MAYGRLRFKLNAPPEKIGEKKEAKMAKKGTEYKSDVDLILDGKDDYVIIRIGERDGEVKVFSIDGTIQSKGPEGNDKNDLQPLKADQMGLSKESKGIEFIDAAFWYKGSPICVIHGNKRYR
jgi:hypothetical protein